MRLFPLAAMAAATLALGACTSSVGVGGQAPGAAVAGSSGSGARFGVAVPAVQPAAAGVPQSAAEAAAEDQKRAIANMRDAGYISYEEAARRQYEIQRNTYPMSPAEHAYWNAAFGIAAMVDRRQITPAEYQVRIRAAYAQIVGA